MRFLALLFAALLLVTSLAAQEGPRKGRKPVLIRDEPTEEKAEEEVVEQNPRLCEEHLKVGEFYLKRDNYKAAEERFREAVKYNPRSVQAYEKLVRSLEKQKNYSEAIAACEEFIAVNPRSKEAVRFQDRAEEFRNKLLKR